MVGINGEEEVALHFIFLFLCLFSIKIVITAHVFTCDSLQLHPCV